MVKAFWSGPSKKMADSVKSKNEINNPTFSGKKKKKKTENQSLNKTK